LQLNDKNSKKAWGFIKKLNRGQTIQMSCVNVTANQVASELLRNGKPNTKVKKRKIKRNREEKSCNFQDDFSMEELSDSLQEMKNGNAARYDEITTEQIKHFGIETRNWLLKLLNVCLQNKSVLKMRKKAKVLAFPKTGKDLSNLKSYRPIFILCHTYKLYEKMILNRIKT